jgi:phage head maturation protease
MSITQIPGTTETAERPFLVRSFEAAAVEVEGRTVDVRLVPFGEVARVADPPDFEPYEEEWLPGCFDHQLKAANRIHANYEHLQGPTHIVGHGLALRSESDGYHLTSTIHETNAGDTTLALLRGGALPSVSLEARPVRNVRSKTGVIQRAKAHLRGFAFCREGAFVGAQVLAVRTDDGDEQESTVDAAWLPFDMNPELVERLRARGVQLPSRYEAHPENTGTPSDEGTPDDGTRRTEEPLTPEE